MVKHQDPQVTAEPSMDSGAWDCSCSTLAGLSFPPRSGTLLRVSGALENRSTKTEENRRGEEVSGGGITRGERVVEKGDTGRSCGVQDGRAGGALLMTGPCLF